MELSKHQQKQQQRTLRWHPLDAAVVGGSSSDHSYDNVLVMVNGMPGPMATAAAEACLRKGLKLAPFAMTGPGLDPMTISVLDLVTNTGQSVRLIPSDETTEIQALLCGLRTTMNEQDLLLAIDYTHPSAVNSNAEFYVKNNIPFVMGTTGGNRTALMETTQSHFCVIAPNMGKQIVAMQAALEQLANDFPGAFGGYTLQVVESHQVTKADTSGTAKAVIDSLCKLSADTNFTYQDIQMIRNEQDSLNFGVPADALKGHAFHTYTLTSPDQSVQFQLQHNVAGRTVYAEGTADAAKFLATTIRKNNPNAARVYTMIDVLREGALE
jgi:4-hydroxy-tetrahydrodipicolinate reductase